MQAYGSDRVRAGDGDQFVLQSRIAKAWKPRVPKSLTSAEFPGTAVLWDERYFEVIEAEALPQGGVSYVLEPWPEMHIMRTTDRYDSAREEERLLEYRAQLSRETKRKSANLMAIFAGHLPAAVQEEMGRELGIAPARLTIISALGAYAVVVGLVLWIVSQLVAQTSPSAFVLALTFFLFFDSGRRFFWAWMTGKPSGSLLGILAYVVYYYTIADRARATSPFARERGTLAPITDAPPDRQLTDALLLREPLVTLLSITDQERIAVRFGYDYRRQSSFVACLILAFGLLGVATSVYRGAVISFIAASAVSAEQVYRLLLLRRSPAASVLGLAARPFLRKLL